MAFLVSEKPKRGGGRPPQYKDSSGNRIPSVTTVLGRFKESGALINWAYRRGVDGLPLYESRDSAAAVGSIVHDMAEALLTDDSEQLEAARAQADELTDDERDAVENGYTAFRSWFSGARISVIETETPLISDAHGFAGTFDALGRDGAGKLVLLDWKTSGGLYPEYLVQLGAYALLLAERGDNVEEAHLCRFSKEFGNFSHHQITSKMLSVGRAQFLLLLAAYKNDSELKRMVR